MDLPLLQIAEFAHPKASIQQDPDDELFLERLARVDDPVALLGAQRLTHEDVAHAVFLSPFLIKVTVLSLSAES